MSNKLQLFTGAPTKTDRQILALQRQAGRYPSAKKKIKVIKQRRSWGDYLSK